MLAVFRNLALIGLVLAPAAAQNSVQFNRDIRPILSARCFHCHGHDAARRKARLRLDDAVSARRVITPNSIEKSELWHRISTADAEDRMPPVEDGEALSAEELGLIKRWIASGAQYERHWAYAPVNSVEPPSVPDNRWSQRPIDRFIYRGLRRAGLEPASAADPVTAVRRLHFDLTGLPVSPRIVRAFEKTPGDASWEKLVDELLSSPEHAEHLAVFWLDLVRYADTVGYHGDQEHAASPYRDWVIKALHDDMPFDRFTIEQLAGDLLPDADIDQKIASGYNRLLQTTHEGGAQDGEYIAKMQADRVRNLSLVWMGVTVGCAECHDHKYDPYAQRDFYALSAFFADIQQKGFYGSPNTSPTTRPPEIDVLGPFQREAIASRVSLLEETDRQGKSAPPGRREELTAWIAAEKKRTRKAMITVSVKPRTTRVLPRGDWMDESGEVVLPAVPAVVGVLPPSAERRSRLDLARWLVSGKHPQTARVFANRIWARFFGEGISRSLDDNGSQSEPPSHPELLDHLAKTFVEDDWSIRRLIKRIVMSRAYRQAAVGTSQVSLDRDPENRLFSRQRSWRLPAEAIRDTLLVHGGLLVRGLGGRSVRPAQPPGFYVHLNFPKRKYKPDTGTEQYRRGVYVHWQRQFLHPMLSAFDAPTREEGCARRARSNTPLAALVLLNDPTSLEAARGFARRLEALDGDDTGRIRWALLEVVGRDADVREVRILRELFDGHLDHYRRNEKAAHELAMEAAPDVARRAAWISVARVLLNLDETLTRL